MNFNLVKAATGIAVVAASVFAGPFTPTLTNDLYVTAALRNAIPTANCNNDGIPDLYDAYNALAGTTYSQNYQLDPFFVSSDEIWTMSGTQGTVAIIGLTADYKNTLGYYTASTETDLLGPYNGYGFEPGATPPGGGAHNTIPGAFPAATFTLDQGTQFGWYLKVDAGADGSNDFQWHSEAARNAGGLDHMMAFTLGSLSGQTQQITMNGEVVDYTFNNPYLIGFEDLPLSGGVLGDEDYDDMMYVIDFTPAQNVPEPGTLALMGVGILGLAFIRRRISK
jgi:hypothetical protein